MIATMLVILLTDASPQTRRAQSGHRIVRWLRRVLLGLLVLVGGLVLTGLIYQATATVVDESNYPPPGQLVDVGGHKLHIYCTGAGSPTVILDASSIDTVSNWAWVQPEVAKTTRVCAYDRAGLGWSDLGPEPRDARRNSLELHTLLQRSSITGPDGACVRGPVP